MQIPLISDPTKAQVYDITVTAKIGSTVKSTKTFTLTVYQCDSLTIKPAKFTDPAPTYTIGDPQQNIDWSNSDLAVYETLCGPIVWSVTNEDNSPLDASIYTAQLTTEPYSLIIHTEDESKSTVSTLKVTATYEDHLNANDQVTFDQEIKTRCIESTTILTLVALNDQNQRVSEAAKTFPLAFSVTP